jgi:hypothetical protein
MQSAINSKIEFKIYARGTFTFLDKIGVFPDVYALFPELLVLL